MPIIVDLPMGTPADEEEKRRREMDSILNPPQSPWYPRPEEPWLRWLAPIDPQSPVPQIGVPGRPLRLQVPPTGQKPVDAAQPQQPNARQFAQPVALSAETLADIIRRKKARYSAGWSPGDLLQDIIKRKQQMADDSVFRRLANMPPHLQSKA
jgi:hypothetical protein